jgi:hypothetical protein
MPRRAESWRSGATRRRRIVKAAIGYLDSELYAPACHMLGVTI